MEEYKLWLKKARDDLRWTKHNIEAKEFAGADKFVVILGDNIFEDEIKDFVSESIIVVGYKKNLIRSHLRNKYKTSHYGLVVSYGKNTHDIYLKNLFIIK